MQLLLSVLLAAAFIGLAASPALSSLNQRTIPVEGTSIVLNLWEESLPDGEMAVFYSIAEGSRSLRTAQASYELGLLYAHFDPLAELPAVHSALTADETNELYIVQFHTQPLEAFQSRITELGGTVRHYIAQFAYLVEMEETTQQAVSQLPYVRWVGAYHPAYRLEESLFENVDNAWSAYPSLRYNIQVLSLEQKAIVANRIMSIGGFVNHPDAGKFLVEATLNPDQLFQVARFNEVNFIDVWGPYEDDMNNVRILGGANYLETVAGYTGTGVRGEIFDGGCLLNHQDFTPNIIAHGTVDNYSHGTACAGICFGDGSGNATARGLMPDGQGIAADYGYVGLTGGGRYTNSMQLLNAPYNAVFQTSSVGSPRTTTYTTISAEADAYCFDSDITHCQSQSNSGWEDSRPQAWAKNMVSGGAVYHYNTETRSDDMWNGGASIGPASDGRIKPTLIGFYDQVYTTYSTSITGYGNFSGTSSGTPIVAGHIGLFYEMWNYEIFGNTVPVPGGTVFQNRPHAPTAKAALVNTAYQYPFSGPTHDKTRVHQGWGFPDVANLYNLRNNMLIVDEDDVLVPFQTASYTVNVEAGTPELKVTMVYADPPGNPAVQTQHRINDLTLKVISPSNVTYWGNYGLYDGVWSLSGGNADTKNTVENVFIANPASGQWTIEVQAVELIQDSHPETGALDADFALVISGFGEAAPPNLFIELTYNSGSPVPAGGGNLYFDVFVENQGASAVNFDAWLDVEYEGGAPTTVVQRAFTNFLPGWTIDRPNMFFPVPGAYAAGNYEFFGRVGSHPGDVWAESGFPFTKSGDDSSPGFQPFVPDGVPNPFADLDIQEPVANVYSLAQNYPNPFNPTTTLNFALTEAGNVNLSVYDVNGRLVSTLVNGYRNVGSHDVTFDASGLPSGVYIYRLNAGDFSASGKMILMK
ncbi:S8 family peptidase [bacterium]|nr:S8 family peptidase [bacterium]